jgi:hypothetical protein
MRCIPRKLYLPPQSESNRDRPWEKEIPEVLYAAPICCTKYYILLPYTSISLAPAPITSTMFLVQYCKGDVCVSKLWWGRESRSVRGMVRTQNTVIRNEVYSEANSK